MALRNAVKIAVISESEEALAEHSAAPALAVIAAPATDAEPLSEALLWWVKEHLWLSEEPPAAASEAAPVETPTEAPSPVDAPTTTEATPPPTIEVELVETPAPTEERAPTEPPPKPAVVVEPAAEPQPIASPPPCETENPLAPWRTRAAATRAMAATLPAGSTSLMIGKIAALYDELAEEPAGAAETPMVDRPRPPLP